ncbi:MAG TPA: double-strand break repair protein AddB, partial [Rhodospirillales bacterium]|nr:double-strand break repair protein AddB [Rhodospirillales bacterium]
MVPCGYAGRPGGRRKLHENALRRGLAPLSGRPPEDKLTPGVYTIPAGMAFLDVLAGGILENMCPRPQDLSKITLLLPTRRACRALGEAFLRASGGTPLLLPRMTPLGDIDEDELAFADTGGDDPLDLAPAIPGMKRPLMLARMILGRQDTDASPDQAVRLAQELAGLLDQVHTERLSFDQLAGLVEGDTLSAYWQTTLKFLTLLSQHWPHILADEKALDPARRRNDLLAAQAKAWATTPPPGPVIAAGSTGSIPATADLLKVIAGLPAGFLVLPGLDRAATDDVWHALSPSHPQYGMAHLLEHLEIDRQAVADWPGLQESTVAQERRKLMNLALRPAETTGSAPHQAIAAAATQGLVRLDAATPQEEAKSIALIMRHTLETPQRTAALVTPDRALARRVTEQLLRWDIRVDDSAGKALSETPPGAFIRLTARMIADDLAPVPLLATLKHPLAAAGQAPATFRAWVRALERLLLHGPRPGPGIDGLRHAIVVERNKADQRGHHDRTRELQALVPGLDDLAAIVQPLCDLMAEKEVSLGRILKSHTVCMEALAARESGGGADYLWRGEDGEAAAAFIADLADNAAMLGERMAPRHYVALLDTLMATRRVRPRYGQHARLHIWGNLEARLQSADVMILGGLNEGSWPPEAKPSPWMSRPMARDFGLPLPERRVGLSAHDFAQAACAPTVILTRADRVGGTPTVPSRWLQRLDNALAGAGQEKALDPQDSWLAWANGLDQPQGPPRPVDPPAPRPPVDVRPRTLPVTRIRSLVRDPYALYAER